MALMLEDWRDGIDGGEVANAIPSFADGLLVQQAIEAARESAAGRGWVALA